MIIYNQKRKVWLNTSLDLMFHQSPKLPWWWALPGRNEKVAALNQQIRIVNLQLCLTEAAEAEECSLKCNNRFGRLCRKYQDISPAVMQDLMLWVDITLFSSTGVPAPACNENVWQKMVAYSKVWIVCFLSNCKTALVHVRRFVYLKKNILPSTVKVAKTLMVFSPV